MSLNFYEEDEDIEKPKEESLNNYIDLFKDYIYEVPNLREALIFIFKAANLNEEQINKYTDDIITQCDKQMTKNFDQIKIKYPKITLEEAKIISSYTCESGMDSDYSPFRLLNRNMVSENRKQGIKNISKYLYMLLKSLRKLSRYQPQGNSKYLYRCVNKIVNYKIDTFNKKLIPYLAGNEKTLWSFTSTSYEAHTSYAFLGKNGKFKEGTIFTFSGDLWGYDITLFNVFGEEEILIEPERKIFVKETKPPINQILQTRCKILQTPLVLDSLINSNDNDELINFDSKILENQNEYKQILLKWLAKPGSEIKGNVKEMKLLYRGTRDGFEAKTFHEKCDNKGETLTIIKSTDNFIFGGYTEIDWDSTLWNGHVGEKNCSRREGKGNEFVFTLKNPHNISPSKFNMRKEWLNHSICCDGNLGPIFGCNDIRIENNCNVKKNKFTYSDFKPGEYCFDDTTGKKRLLFTGNNSFLVSEIEVFNVIR